MRTKPDRSNAIPPEPHAKLLAELEGFEHLLFEPMTQTDLDQLYALSERWTAQFGDSPEAIALCDALEDFIGAGIEDADVEKAYRELVECVQQTPSRVSHP